MDRARIAVRSVIDRDDRAADRVGKDARLDIVFERRAGRTVIAREYAEPPFRVGRVFLQDDGGAHLIVASSAPGIFGGDSLQQSVRVGPGARVRLTSQSALQIHPSGEDGTAVLDSRFVVEHGASLRCEWDPNIPFADARVQQRIEIDLADDAHLFWSDAVMSGREARGERWRFSSLEHELRLRRGGSTTYLERYRIDQASSPASRWLAHDTCYLGTVLVAGTQWSPESVAALHEDLNALEGIRAAADVLQPGVLLVRLMAVSGVPFHRARALVTDRLET
jgi:urease accessory protein